MSGNDALRAALAVIHAWDEDDEHGTYADLAARFAAWAEQQARERAAAELRAAADELAYAPAAKAAWLRTRADALTADDRTVHA